MKRPGGRGRLRSYGGVVAEVEIDFCIRLNRLDIDCPPVPGQGGTMCYGGCYNTDDSGSPEEASVFGRYDDRFDARAGQAASRSGSRSVL